MSDNKEQFINTLTSITRDFLLKMELTGEINVLEKEENSQCLVLSVTTDQNVDDLIHRNASGIKSVEHILRLIVSQKIPKEDHINFILDINDYRKTQSNRLVKIAKEAADRVRASKRAEALMPMSSYERRLVHLELASYSDIATESIGEDPKRRVVIKPL